MPKVSVIIPVYNTEKYLKECLDSVVNQTLKDIEIICVNDGSKDNSLEILEEYAKNDERIVIVNKKNTNAGDSRNIGFKKATGDYVLFFDSDDYMELNTLEVMHNNANANDCDIVVCEAKKLDEKTKTFRNLDMQKFIKDKLKGKNIVIPNETFTYLYQGFNGWAWDKLIKRDLITNNNIKFDSLRHSNDLTFTYLALSLANKILLINDILMIHRYHSTSIEATRKKKPDCFYYAINSLKNELIKRNIYEIYKQTFLNFCAGFVQWYIRTISGFINKIIMKRLFKKFVKENYEKNVDISYFHKKNLYFYIKKYMNSFIFLKRLIILFRLWS